MRRRWRGPRGRVGLWSFEAWWRSGGGRARIGDGLAAPAQCDEANPVSRGRTSAAMRPFGPSPNRTRTLSPGLSSVMPIAPHDLDMDEDVLRPLPARHEAEAPDAVEPFHDRDLEAAGRHDLHMRAGRRASATGWMAVDRSRERTRNTWRPLVRRSTSQTTRAPSRAAWKPSRRRVVTWMSTSGRPLSGTMKPYPLDTSNHLISPAISTRSSAASPASPSPIAVRLQVRELIFAAQHDHPVQKRRPRRSAPPQRPRSALRIRSPTAASPTLAPGESRQRRNCAAADKIMKCVLRVRRAGPRPPVTAGPARRRCRRG